MVSGHLGMALLKGGTTLVRVHSAIIIRAVVEANTVLGSTLIHLLVEVEANKTLGHIPGLQLLVQVDANKTLGHTPGLLLLLIAHHPKLVGEGAGFNVVMSVKVTMGSDRSESKAF